MFTSRGAFAGFWKRETIIEGDAGFPSQEGSASVARLDARLDAQSAISGGGAEKYGVDTKYKRVLFIRVRRAKS